MAGFEWDEAKNAANIGKHRIDFSDAATLWRRPVIDPAVSRQVDGENRQLAIGTIVEPDSGEQLIIAVVYTMRGTSRRLISARRARTNERLLYRKVWNRGY